MSDLLKQKLINYFESLESSVQNVLDFSKEQIPDVIHQYLQWTFWDNAIGAILFFIGAVISIKVMIYLHRQAVKHFWTKNYPVEEPWSVVYMWIVVPILFTVLFISCTRQAIKVQVAPKVVIIEQLVELGKSTTNK